MTGLQAVFALILTFTIALPANSCGKEKVNNKSSSEAAMQERRVPEGKWGGQHVRLEVLADGADFEFDCAHGRLQGPLLLQNGRFTATGTYVREGGPVRLDEGEQGQRVFFKGEVEGSRMILSFSFAVDFSEAETFTLTHGVEARLFKCK